MIRSNLVRIILILIISVSSPFFAQNIHSDPSLMPVPKEIIMKEGKFRITNQLEIKISGNPDERIYPAATRALRRLDARTGMFFPQDHITPDNAPDNANVLIECSSAGKIELGQDESYKLSITENLVILKAPTDLGAMHGLETLLQLLNSDEDGYYFPCLIYA